jgi:hypothetical protein
MQEELKFASMPREGHEQWLKVQRDSLNCGFGRAAGTKIDRKFQGEVEELIAECRSAIR